MSLINQMLKDLAKRTAPLTNPDMIIAGLTPSNEFKNKKRQIIWFGLFILFLITIVAIFFHQSSMDILPEANHKEEIFALKQEAKTPPKIDTFVLPHTQTELTGITLQAQNKTTNIRLLLSQNALYRINSYKDNHLTLTLEHTQLIANLPQIDTMNSAIKFISMKNQKDGSLKIDLLLNSHAELNHTELVGNDKLTELQLDFLFTNSIPNNDAAGEMVEDKQTSSIKRISYSTSIQDEYQEAMQVASQGQNNEAIQLLKKLLERQATFIPARKALVTFLIKEGYTSFALKELEIGLQLQPFQPEYVQLKAQIFMNKGKTSEALALLLKAPPAMEENPEYHSFIAALYQKENKFLLAEQKYEQLLQLYPDQSVWWMGLGIVKEKLNKNKEALAAYTKANQESNLSPELKVYIETRMHALA